MAKKNGASTIDDKIKAAEKRIEKMKISKQIADLKARQKAIK